MKARKARPHITTARPPTARRELEKAETRRLILETARTMFAREGYDSTTMRGIADRIGFTATAIYHHFADKDALMLELCLSDFRALGAALTSIGGITDPIERIRQMGRNYVRFAVEHPEQFRFMFLSDRPMAALDETKQLDPDHGGYEFLKQAVTEAIAAHRFRREFEDPDVVAQMLWAGVHGIATIHIHVNDKPSGMHEWLDLHDPQETALAMCDAMMHGLLRPR